MFGDTNKKLEEAFNEKRTVSNPVDDVSVWLVECGIHFGGSWIIGVYSTLERAEKSKEELNGEGDYIHITEITIDKNIDT